MRIAAPSSCVRADPSRVSARPPTPPPAPLPSLSEFACGLHVNSLGRGHRAGIALAPGSPRSAGGVRASFLRCPVNLRGIGDHPAGKAGLLGEGGISEQVGG